MRFSGVITAPANHATQWGPRKSGGGPCVIALENRNGAERGDALKFQKLLKMFEFVLILVLF